MSSGDNEYFPSSEDDNSSEFDRYTVDDFNKKILRFNLVRENNTKFKASTFVLTPCTSNQDESVTFNYDNHDPSVSNCDKLKPVCDDRPSVIGFEDGCDDKRKKEARKKDPLLTTQNDDVSSQLFDRTLPDLTNCDSINAQAGDVLTDQTLSQMTCDELCDKIFNVIEEGINFSETESASGIVEQSLAVKTNTTTFCESEELFSDSLLYVESEIIIPPQGTDSEVLRHVSGNENLPHFEDALVPVQLNSPTDRFETNMEARESDRGAEKDKRTSIKKRLMAKTSRMLGESYTGFRRAEKGSTNIVIQDVDRASRTMKPSCRSQNCKDVKTRMCDQIAEDQREKLFHSFWKEMNWDEKKMFVCSTVDVKFAKRKTTMRDSRRTYSLSYFLKINDTKVPVCKKMYLDTLALKKSEVACWITKYVENNYPRARNSERDLDDAAGNLGNDAAVNDVDHPEDNAPDNPEDDNEDTPRDNAPDENFHSNGHLTGQSRRARKHKVKFLKNFLTALPKLESHYCRNSTSKLYLQTEIRSVGALYSIYEKHCKETSEYPLGRSWFDKTFKDMNLGIFSPRKDMCDVCYTYKSGNLDEEAYNLHIAKKDRARAEKQRDKLEAEASKCHVICNDLMAVQMIPLIRASAAYYKLKLTVHNFTVYNLKTRDSQNYWFDETSTTLCASTFASCLVDYVTELVDGSNSKLPVVIYSDGCTYQNRNAILANALLHLSVEKQICITQKFLEKGHTQFECDSVHSAIERKYSKVDVYLPSQFCVHTAHAREKPQPYRTKYVDFSFFKDYSQTSTMTYSSIRPGKRAGEPTVTDLKVINYLPDGTITYKLDFNQDELPMPMSRNRRQIDRKPFSFPALHNQRLPIPYDKWQDLQSLKPLIPSDCHAFYDSLPHTGLNQSIRALKRKNKQPNEPSGSKKRRR